MKTLHIIISGLVQGVGFRSFVKRNAERMGINGWVRNTDDDQLEIVVQGRDVDRFVELCRKGPGTARIDDIEIEEIEEEKMNGFGMR